MRYVSVLTLALVISLFPQTGLFAAMSSANYGIPNDAMTGGGGDTSSSTNFGVKDTLSQPISGGSTGTLFGSEQGYRAKENSILSIEFVNSTGTTIASPTANFITTNPGYSSVGVLGNAVSKIRITNTRSIATWSITLAATGGPGAKWVGGANNLTFDHIGAGMLTVNPVPAIITPIAGGCATTDLSLGVQNTFSQGIVDSITLLSAGGGADTNCIWDLTGIGLSQSIPTGQAAASYQLGMTLTIS